MERSAPTFTGYACAIALLGAVMLSRCARTTETRATDPEPLAPAVAPLPAPASASAIPTATASSVSTHRYRVAALGDSLTDPQSQGGKYLDYLRERCPLSRFDGHGKGGHMVNQIRRRLESDGFGSADAGLGRDPYTHVIVFGGVNDLLSDQTAGRTPRKITADLAAIYAAAHDHGARVVAITVAPWGGHPDFNPSRAEATREVNRWIAEQPASGAVDHVVDSVAVLSCGDPQRLCKGNGGPFKDGLHFGAEGHRALGEALYRQVFSDCE